VAVLSLTKEARKLSRSKKRVGVENINVAGADEPGDSAFIVAGSVPWGLYSNSLRMGMLE
jgi:hypothetical protein